MNKKGFLPIVGLFYILGALLLLGVLIFLGFKVSGFLSDAWLFFKRWWWAFLVGIFLLSPAGQAIIKKVLRV